MKNLDIPLLFWHRGNSAYLKIALNQSSKYNNNIILLGDQKNQSITDDWYDMDVYYDDRFDEFKKYYEHLSKNDEKFELICFERYFYIYNFCKYKNINKFIMCDSDLLVFSNISKTFKNIDLAFSRCSEQSNYRWSISPHCSVWTLDYLNLFLEFCIETYKNDKELLHEKYRYHIESNIKGGICDMTLLYLWTKTGIEYQNTAKIFGTFKEKKCLDHGISFNENYNKKEYKFSKLTGSKTVKFINDVPFFINKENELVKVLVIHCNGGFKDYMNKYSECSNSLFSFFYIRIKHKVKKMITI